MERLNYIVEDSTIAELLGVQNFTNKESAVLELVKNAYDARAKKVVITINSSTITIRDDGIGMDKQTIRNNWMHVGKSEKGYSVISNDEERVLAGSKGIGRFALARLGASASIYSAKEHSEPLLWKTDWNESALDNWIHIPLSFVGTNIEISSLRDRWTENSIANLCEYLSITYNDNKMAIDIVSPTQKYCVSQYFESPTLGGNCVTTIKLKYDSNRTTLSCSITSDEFRPEAQQYCPIQDITSFEKTINIVDEFISEKDIDYDRSDLISILTALGDFSSELYFSLKSPIPKDCERFLYKYENLPARFEKGVVLYRNAFSISSYDGGKDWVGFGKRSRKSPAAATHPTGAWRVRENQMAGKVVIDKKENANLKDLSNRQGLDENDSFVLFVKIINAGIAIFEKYRQELIRLINVKNEIPESTKPVILQELLRNPSKAKELTVADVQSLATELSTLEKESKAYKEEKNSTEERYRYDVRILNVLATSGLKATSIAHELKNDRNSVSVNYSYIVSALKEYDFWDELNSAECTAHSYKNVPYLLKRNNDISEKILIFMDTMLDEVEKQKFTSKKLSIYELLDSIKSNWERDYACLNITLEIREDLFFDTSEDVFTVIFDNLILNSLQQNEHQNRINITIAILQKNSSLDIFYCDDGGGLSPKYLNDPMRILMVHETSRKNGHGLGMWIVNNTVLMTGGLINKIDGHDGFKIYLELGDRI